MSRNLIIDDEYVLRHRLQVGNPGSSVAICALWKDLSKVSLDGLLSQKVALVGNLYTNRGISLLLRGLWRMPSVRHLIIWGPDTQHTGRSALALWQHGISDGFTIADTDISLDICIPRESIDVLRLNVQIYDCRSIRDVSKLAEFISGLSHLDPHDDPQVFPEPEPLQPTSLPSLHTGWRVATEKVAFTWPRILDLVMRFGEVKSSQYQIRQREILNVMSIVTSEDAEDLFLPPYMNLSLDSLTEYFPRILEDFPADDISYTYGNRLHGYFGRNQFESMVAALKSARDTRRALAALWDVRSDPERETPPCITQVVMNVINDRLHLTYSARSQDMFSAWPQNTLAMIMLQKRAAKELGVVVGPLTCQTISAHIYEHDWQRAADTLASTKHIIRSIDFDPQGNFVIRVERSQIQAELHDSGGNVLWHMQGTSSAEIGREIASLQLASLPSHYVYLGRELQRAEDALRRGLPFDQGMA